jgi:TIR domain
MAFVTKSQVLAYANQATLRKAMAADAILNEEALASVKANAFDIFLSHSYLDKKFILGTKRFIESKGHSVYVDWINDQQLDRSKVTPETAKTLRKSMNKCSCLIYAYSPNVTQSRWCPWELGYFDGKNGNAFVMPLVDDESEGFKGVEYVGLYHKIVEEEAQDGTKCLYVKKGSEDYVYLGKVISDAG